MITETRTLTRLFLMALMALMPACLRAQDAVAVAEMPEKTAADASLGNDKAIAVFLMKSDNIIISSSNHRDVVGTAAKQKDGQWAVEVTCDLADKGIERQRTFTALIKNTSLKGSVSKTVQPGKRYYFTATEAKHMLNLWWPETRNILYPVAGKSCLELQIPANITDLDLKFSDGIGGKVTRRTETGLNILALEIDCKKLQAFIADMEAKEQAFRNAEDAYHSLKTKNDERMNEPNFNFDAAEAQEKELENAMNEAANQIPQLFIVLSGDGSNQVEVDPDKVRSLLVKPKYKLTVGVNDNLHKEIVGTTPFAEKLRSANQAWQSRRFKEAITFYEQAAADKDATEADKTACTGWIETIKLCLSARDAANDALLLLKRFKENREQVSPEKIIELYDVAINNYTTLYSLTRNDYYQKSIEAITKSKAKIGIVMSGTVVSSDLKQGVFVEKPVTGIDIYAVEHYDRSAMSKGIHGEKVGTVDAEGRFKLELKRDVYEGLLFIPVANREFKRNVFQPLHGNKHLDIHVRFSKD